MTLPFDFLDKRPIIVALAGSNGSGKSTFYESYQLIAAYENGQAMERQENE